VQSTDDKPLNGLRVLIVEDELVVAMELESLLKELGCNVLALAPSVERALRALDRELPDVALLDVNVQGERVTPVAEALEGEKVPFVLVTGYGGGRLREPPLQTAPRLCKPVDRRQLAQVLEAVASP
jgi:CheY-like chemotaxis protein